MSRTGTLASVAAGYTEPCPSVKIPETCHVGEDAVLDLVCCAEGEQVVVTKGLTTRPSVSCK